MFFWSPPFIFECFLFFFCFGGEEDRFHRDPRRLMYTCSTVVMSRWMARFSGQDVRPLHFVVFSLIKKMEVIHGFLLNYKSWNLVQDREELKRYRLTACHIPMPLIKNGSTKMPSAHSAKVQIQGRQKINGAFWHEFFSNH